jgi:hypothetical protein
MVCRNRYAGWRRSHTSLENSREIRSAVTLLTFLRMKVSSSHRALVCSFVFVAAACGSPRESQERGLEEAALRASSHALVMPIDVTPRPASANPVSATSKEPEKPKSTRSTVTTSAANLKVTRLVVAQGVEAREPMGVAKSFRKADIDKIFAYVEVENRDAAEEEIVVTFEPEGLSPRGNVKLRVGQSPRWRTWAFTRAIDRTGQWVAVVRTKDGKELAREPFEISS